MTPRTGLRMPFSTVRLETMKIMPARANASLELYCMEKTHYKNIRISNLYISQQADSHVYHNIITLHNGVTRNRTELVF